MIIRSEVDVNCERVPRTTRVKLRADFPYSTPSARHGATCR